MEDQDQIHRVAEEAAERAVHRTLETLGVDVDNPLEVQADLQTLRDLRLAKQRGAAALIWTVVGLLASGAMALMWDALRGHR